MTQPALDSPCTGRLCVHPSAHTWSPDCPSPPAVTRSCCHDTPHDTPHVAGLFLVPSFCSWVHPSVFRPHHQAGSTVPCGLPLGTSAGSWQAADQVQVLKCHQPLSGTYGWLPGWERFEVALPPPTSCAFVPPSYMEVACCVFTLGEMSFGKY